MRGGKLSSTSLFNTSLSHPYVFCTTLPSLERGINKGEWSFISLVGSARVQAPDSLIHDLTRLKKSGPILTGAISPRGNLVAMVESRGNNQGRLILMPVAVEEAGGLSTMDFTVLEKGTLAVQDNERIKISPTAVRFCQMDGRLCLVAVDIEGKVTKKTFEV
jgi:hypothetical protein